MIAAYRQETGRTQARQVSGNWNLWVDRHEWQDRAAAYDSHLQQLALEERRRLAREDDKKWLERRRAIREREFEASERLLDKAEEILRLPILEEEIKETVDGEEVATVVMKPAGVRIRDASRMMHVASTLARLASGMPSDSKPGDEERETEGTKVLRFPVATMTAEEWSEQFKKKA